MLHSPCLTYFSSLFQFPFVSGLSLLTQSDAVNLGPLGVRYVSEHLLDDLLFYLWDGVTVQHLDGRHVWTLALNQHLQGLTEADVERAQRMCKYTRRLKERTNNNIHTCSEQPAVNTYTALWGECCHGNWAPGSTRQHMLHWHLTWLASPWPANGRGPAGEQVGPTTPLRVC